MKKMWMAGIAAAVTAGAITVPAVAGAAEGSETNNGLRFSDVANYCAEVQIKTAGLDRGAVTIVIDEYTSNADVTDPKGFSAFKKSKPATDIAAGTITVSQLVARDTAGNPTQVLCKTKAFDGLEATFGPEIFDPETPAMPANAVTESVLREALVTTDPALRAKVAKRLDTTIVDPTTYQLGGNGWAVLNFETIKADAGLTHLRTNALSTSADPAATLPNPVVDALNAQFGRFLPAPLPYGTTQGDLIRAGLLDAGILGTLYTTTPTVNAVAAALTA
jgi:hypothetical protein